MSQSKPTREERLDRQDFDTGDPDDEVVGTQSSYHDDEGCKYVEQADERKVRRDLSREEAQRRWLGPCVRCVLGGLDE